MPTFEDYPNFEPNLTPRQIFKMGSFGGTYFRPIYSSIKKKEYKNVHKKFPEEWFKNIPDSHLTTPFNEYDKNINKYKVKVGTTLEEWENAGWITKQDPYGFVQWYMEFFSGRRTSDDERQIKRYNSLAGPNGRFRKRLISIIKSKQGEYDDYAISPKIRQTLQHWGYKLTKKDFDDYKK
jgi:hypothetical protein